MTATREQVTREEREARERLRRAEKMLKGADKARVRQRREAMRAALRETATTYPACKCDLHVGTTAAELRALGGGCTDPHFCCPRLAAIRRRFES